MTELVSPDPSTVDKMVQAANTESSVAEIDAKLDSDTAEAEDDADGAALTCNQCGKGLGESCAESAIVGGRYCSAQCVKTAEAEAGKWRDSVEDSVDGKPPWAQRSDEHKWIEYRGDRLAIRTPMQSALTSYGMQVSDGSTPARKSKASRQIVQNHMSPDSFDRIMDRMGDPDDEFDDDDLSNVVTQILELRTGPLPQPNRAQRRHPNA